MNTDSIQLLATSEVPLTLIIIVVGLLIAGSLVKIATVLSLLRVGFGVDGFLGGTIVLLLSIALSAVVVAPVAERSFQLAQQALPEADRQNNHATDKLDNDKLANALLTYGVKPWEEFLIARTDKELLERFSKVATRNLTKLEANSAATQSPASQQPETPTSVTALIAAFVVTELREAMYIGLRIVLPFVVIEFLVAQALVVIGLTNLSCSLVSLPLKLLVFTAVGGWSLITESLIGAYAN